MDVMNKTVVRVLKRFLVKRFQEQTNYWDLKRSDQTKRFEEFVDDF